MERYKDFKPTQFDRKGSFLPDRGEWFVTPVIQTDVSIFAAHRVDEIPDGIDISYLAE